MSQPPQGPPQGWGAQGPSPYGPPPGGSAPGAPRRRGGGRTGLLVGGAAVAVLAVVGGGVWAATSFLGTGAQPAETLPAETLAYVSVDLDPSGGQKLEALRTLQKFPIVDDADLGTDADADLRRAFFDLVQESGGGCEGLDYDADLADWLGERAAIGVLPGGEEPDVVGVVQVADEAAADEGLAALARCAATSDADGAVDGAAEEGFGYVVAGEWAVIAEDEETAQDAVDGSEEGSLAADDSFERWTEAAGDPGVVAAYAAPGLADELGPGGQGAAGGLLGGLGDFEGAALTVRFADEGLEVETAGYSGVGAEGLLGSEDAASLLDGLPADTAAVLALGLPDGWLDEVLGQVSQVTGLSTDELAAEASDELGVRVPDDVETLLGQGAALTVSPDVDVEGLADGSTPPEEALVGVRIRTEDPAASEAVLERLRGRLGEGSLLATDAEGDLLAVGPDDGYRAELLADGGLTDEDAFTDAVPEADRSSAVLYLDLDVVDDYAGLVDDLTGDPRVADNLAPLSALGVSVWTEDDAPHSLVRLSTD